MKIKLFNKVKYVLLLSLLLPLTACEDEDKTFQGDPIFAFETGLRFISVTQIDPHYDLPVMLVGPHSNEPKRVEFTVLPEFVNVSGDTIRTTAQPGVEYMAFTTNELTLAANESFTNIPIDINFENLHRDSTYTIVFELLGGDFGVSPIANNIIQFNFTPHKIFLPELLEGTWTAFERSNAPESLWREYELDIELDSIHANGRVFEFLVDGFWAIKSDDHPAALEDVQKIRIIVDDTDPRNSLVTGPTQNFFYHTSTELWVNWNRFSGSREGSFDTWNHEFRFPGFDLVYSSGGNFPPGTSDIARRGRNIRVEITDPDFTLDAK